MGGQSCMGNRLTVIINGPQHWAWSPFVPMCCVEESSCQDLPASRRLEMKEGYRLPSIHAYIQHVIMVNNISCIPPKGSSGPGIPQG